jgi:hypothetical protein
MAGLDTTITGTSGGASSEEEAMQKLVASLVKLPFEPVMLCGWRAFSTWIEILCGTSLGLGVSSDGRGKAEFKMASESAGRLGFMLSRETINTRSAMAWQVDEQRVMLVRSNNMIPDEVAIYDRRSLSL